MTTSYDTLNYLPEIAFIAGTDKVLTFSCFNESGMPLNIGGGLVHWKLCPYGSFSIETLDLFSPSDGVSITGASTFAVTISASDTLFLSGKYIQQIIITDSTNKTFRPAQGTLIIQPAIGT
jgi:hypothetical protein